MKFHNTHAHTHTHTHTHTLYAIRLLNGLMSVYILYIFNDLLRHMCLLVCILDNNFNALLGRRAISFIFPL